MKNILILDDELHIRTLLMLYIKALNYNCIALESVERALELEDTDLIPISKADAIITDFDMGKDTAISLLRYLDENKLSPIVIIRSGNLSCMEQIEKEGYANLVNVFIDKTTSLFDLKAILKGFL